MHKIASFFLREIRERASVRLGKPHSASHFNRKSLETYQNAPVYAKQQVSQKTIKIRKRGYPAVFFVFSYPVHWAYSEPGTQSSPIAPTDPLQSLPNLSQAPPEPLLGWTQASEGSSSVFPGLFRQAKKSSNFFYPKPDF